MLCAMQPDGQSPAYLTRNKVLGQQFESARRLTILWEVAGKILEGKEISE